MLDFERGRMILALPFCIKDVSQAIDLMGWIGQLGGCKSHDCLLVADAAVQWSECMHALALAREHFKSAELISTDEPLDGWPQAANAMFLKAAMHVATHQRQPFFVCEPDCIPLKSGWLDALEEAYGKCGRLFMGAFTRGTHPNYSEPVLAGCAVYPADAYQRLKDLFPCKRAWDVDTAPRVMPQAANTALIQHFFGQMDLPPTFAQSKTPQSTINTFTLEHLKPEAVVFHRNKDGTLLRLLKQKMFPEQSIPMEADVVSLRRAGDIVILLPLLREFSIQWGRPVRLVVHEDFVPLLESVSYVEPVAWAGDWESPLEAARIHKAGNAQVFGKGLKPDTMRGNFARLAWTALGQNWNRHLPLIFDRRDLEREKRLAEFAFRTDKPKILVKLHGHSSPFGEGPFIAEKLKAEFGDAELVWLDDIRADFVFDLVGLMDRASCLVTADTVTLWLAHASKCPMVQFVNNSDFGGSPPRGNCLLRVKYSETLRRWTEISSVIRSALCIQQNQEMVLVFSDFLPPDPDTRRRQDEAYKTWPLLQARLFSFRGPRTSKAMRDSRAMPFVRDAIEAAMAAGSEDIIVVTNNDIKVDERLRQSILASCARLGCWWAYRVEKPYGQTDQGADLFAFTRCWWNCHKRLFPDFLLGYWWWDDVMVRLMRWSGCDEQERLYYHEPHKGALDRLNTTGAAYNNSLANKWLAEHDEERIKPNVHIQP